MCVGWLTAVAALTVAATAQPGVQPVGLRLPPPQIALPFTAEDGGGGGGGGLLSLLARHGALGGHALARKSVRSPSRRLRFGRTDPDMPALPPQDQDQDQDEQQWPGWQWRSRRAPLRLRFGRRSPAAPELMAPDTELMAPLIFPNELQELEERELRSPSMRLRFGRSSERKSDEDADAVLD